MANEEKQNEEEHTHPHWMDTIFSESNRDRFFYETNRYFLVVDDNEIECPCCERKTDADAHILFAPTEAMLCGHIEEDGSHCDCDTVPQYGDRVLLELDGDMKHRCQEHGYRKELFDLLEKNEGNIIIENMLTREATLLRRHG